jgi:hypothetical protein
MCAALMSPIDLTDVLKDAPVGHWIALSHDWERVIATAESLEVALGTAKELGEDSPIVLKVPPAGNLIL